MGNSVIFVVISLLAVVLIYSSHSSVLAATKNPSPRDVCDVFSQGTCECTNDVETLSATCCTLLQINDKGGFVHVCETCSINTDTGDYFNCSVSRKSPTTGQANVPQGGGVLEQPPTPKKHAGTVSQDNGGVHRAEQPQSSNHSPKQNTKITKGGFNINPAIGK
jgi:hypothetical protein